MNDRTLTKRGFLLKTGLIVQQEEDDEGASAMVALSTGRYSGSPVEEEDEEDEYWPVRCHYPPSEACAFSSFELHVNPVNLVIPVTLNGLYVPVCRGRIQPGFRSA